MKIPVCTPNQRTLVATFKQKAKNRHQNSLRKHVKHAQKETQSLVSPIPWKPKNPTRGTCSHPKSVCFGTSESATNTVKRLLFCWAFPVFWRGYRRGRTDLTDLPPVPRRDRFSLNDISLHLCFCVFFFGFFRMEGTTVEYGLLTGTTPTTTTATTPTTTTNLRSKQATNQQTNIQSNKQQWNNKQQPNKETDKQTTNKQQTHNNKKQGYSATQWPRTCWTLFGSWKVAVQSADQWNSCLQVHVCLSNLSEVAVFRFFLKNFCLTQWILEYLQ